jgi:hypothetical protein
MAKTPEQTETVQVQLSRSTIDAAEKIQRTYHALGHKYATLDSAIATAVDFYTAHLERAVIGGAPIEDLG